MARELSGLAGASDNKSVAEIGERHLACGCARRLACLRVGDHRLGGGAVRLETSPSGRVKGRVVQVASSGSELVRGGSSFRPDKPERLKRAKRVLRLFDR